MTRTLFAMAILLIALGAAAHAQDAAPRNAPPDAPLDAIPDAAPPDPAVAALQAEVASLRAREDIRELLHAYGRTIDARDFDAFATLWTDDAEYVGGANAAPVIGGAASPASWPTSSRAIPQASASRTPTSSSTKPSR